jgi:hypothetical protein
LGNKISSKKVQQAIVQFWIRNLEEIPTGLRERNPETLEDRKARTARRFTGECILRGEDIKGCGVQTVPGFLEEKGFWITDAFFQERVSPDNRICYIVRFVFGRNGPCKDFEGKEDAMAALQKMCREATWNVKIFKNPLFLEGRPVPAKKSVCLNLSGRDALLEPNGKPRMVKGGVPRMPRAELGLNLI